MFVIIIIIVIIMFVVMFALCLPVCSENAIKPQPTTETVNLPQTDHLSAFV